MGWEKRSEELELIDLGSAYYTQQEYHSCLEKLDKVGTYLGGDRATFKAMRHLSFSPRSILDVGCGGGGFTKKLAQRYPHAQITGIDISTQAIAYARSKCNLPNVSFTSQDLRHIPSKTVDIVLSTLVCHHFSDQELIPFLNECLRVAKKYVIINDLHRHPLAWVSFRCLAPLLFRHRLITHDGSLSVKRAFVRSDWERYLLQLNIPGKVTWHWPFRWVVVVELT